jgi:urea transport system permease protein
MARRFVERLRERLLELHAPRAWAVVGGAAVVGGVLVPLLNVLPASSPLHLSDATVPLLGKFLCFGMAALAMDLVWGYAGILSLGHGLFFALGGYGMGMYLMRSIAGEGVYRSALPDFMVFLDWKALPWYWHGFQSFPFAIAMALLVPGTLAAVFGWFAFRSRIRGVYLSIVTQALTYAAMLLFFQNATGFGGNNGLTDFKRILGWPLHAPETRRALYVASAIALLATYLLCRFVVTSKLGRVLRAVRDAELKTRFCGYESTRYKLFAWTLSAMLCAMAGALYVPQVGIINPSEMQPSNSIEMAIWVAVGGRGTLGGAVLGAWLVNGGKSWLTAAFPSAWLYAFGALFVGVTLFLPGGIVSFAPRLTKLLAPLLAKLPARGATAAKVASPPTVKGQT